MLPKSENARDWLGLDLRRVSKTGTRLSTSQLVGYVSITADNNPNIVDTSDRERLVSCIEVSEFEEILKTIIALLENERDEDRIKPGNEKPMKDLFAGLSAEDLVTEIVALSDEGAEASEAVPLLRSFNDSLDTARKAIQERFIYYSRMATMGTIAQMLVHEIRNRTTAIGSFLAFIKDRFGPFKDKDLEDEYRFADTSVLALERLADTFAPLANRNFKRQKRQSILEEQIRECLAMNRREIEKKNVICSIPNSETCVAVDPGELDAIIINLVINSLYWLGNVPKTNRRIAFKISQMNNGRVRVLVQDSGPGISAEDIEKIFWPGVTRKPDGIGMGLTIASELVAAYGGRMSTKPSGKNGGALFAFDLPLRR